MDAKRMQPPRERGAVLVEAAFVLPILLVLVFALIDFSNWELERSQASSAARDGARAGIVLSLAPADRSATTGAIESAVKARIPDADSLDSLTIAIYCAGGDASTPYSGCDPAVSGVTRLVVEVSWRYQPVSFVGSTFGRPTVRGRSEMIYVGPRQATNVPPPAVCELEGSPVVGAVPQLSANPGTLLTPGYIEVTFTVRDISLCANRSAEFLRASNATTAGTAQVTTVSGNTVTVRAQTPTPITPDAYTIDLLAGGRRFSAAVQLEVRPTTTCTAVVTAPASAALEINRGQGTPTGDLTGPITGEVRPSGCTGAGTLELVRQDAGGALTVLQAVSSAVSMTTTSTYSFPGTRQSNVGNADFTAGTYFVRLTWGSPEASVLSDPITVPPVP